MGSEGFEAIITSLFIIIYIERNSDRKVLLAFRIEKFSVAVLLLNRQESGEFYDSLLEFYLVV